jgi:hypothetical protein
VLSPERPKVDASGRLEITDHAALMLNPAPRNSWLGIVLEVKSSPARVLVEAEGRFRKSAELKPGSYTRQLRLQAPPTKEAETSPLWVHFEVNGVERTKVYLHKIWLDRPEESPVFSRFGVSSISTGAEGLVKSSGFSGIEYFGTAQEAGRWSRDKAWISLPTSGTAMILRLCAPRPEPASVILSCPAHLWRQALTVDSEWQDIRVPLTRHSGRATVVIETTNPFVPVEAIPGSGDTRTLGVVVGGVRFE